MATPTNVRNAAAVDPWLSFRFIVSWSDTSGGKMSPVAYVSRVGALSRTTDVETWREGGAPQGPRKIPGQTQYGSIVLERGITYDTAFEQWANKVWYYPNSGSLGEEVSLADFRKDIQIQLLNQAGQVVLSYYVFSCWPSSYTALPELDSNANAVAIESLTLENEGWTRDDSVNSVSVPTVTDPSSNRIATFSAPSS